MFDYSSEIAETIVRVFAGIIFLFQGYDKLFNVKITGVVSTFLDEAEHHHIRRPLVTMMAWYTSAVEFFGGIFLILGLFTKCTLYFLGVDLLLVAVAFSVLDAVWDMRHVFPRLILVTALLLFPETWNKFSLDYLINN